MKEKNWGKKKGKVLFCIQLISFMGSFRSIPFCVSLSSLVITLWNSQILNPQAAEYLFLSLYLKWKHKGTEITEEVQVDSMQQFLPESFFFFFPSWIDLTFYWRFGLRRDLGGCLEDSSIVWGRESGSKGLQELLPRAAQPVSGWARADLWSRTHVCRTPSLHPPS